MVLREQPVALLPEERSFRTDGLSPNGGKRPRSLETESYALQVTALPYGGAKWALTLVVAVSREPRLAD